MKDDEHDADTSVVRLDKTWFMIIGVILSFLAKLTGVVIYVSGKAEAKEVHALQVDVVALRGSMKEMRAKYSVRMSSFQEELKRVGADIREIKQLILKQYERRRYYTPKKSSRR